MEVKETGEINYYSENFVNWNLPRFSDIPQKRGLRLWSPKFAYWNENMFYKVEPDGWVGHPLFSTDARLSLTSRSNDGCPLLFIRVGVTDESGKELKVCECIWEDKYRSYYANLVKNSELNRRRNGEIPNGFLRLFCELIHKKSADVVDSGTQTDIETGQDKIIKDFEALLISGKDSDFIIKVSHREFHVHRGILRARSPVFDSMLSHDFTEKSEGFINVEDCDPEIFEDFLLFVYSGKTEHISSDNVCRLYYASDKYNMPDLKYKCVSYLKKIFSVKNICEVICLAVKHSEAELLKLATEYFAKNMEEILVTCQWIQFVKDNPVEANELYIKSLKLGFTKKA